MPATMLQERTPAAKGKPAKPYPDFPLFAHATGRWAKKIRGRFVFFGPWNDPYGALDRYLAQRDELHAGRVPRARDGTAVASSAGPTSRAGAAPVGGGAAADPGGPVMRDLVNRFLTAKQRRMEAGDMGRRSFSDYHAASGRLVGFFGRHRRLDDITPEDFGRYRAELAKVRGPVALGNEIGRVRSIFKFGYESGLLDRPVRYGPEFVRPSRRAVRLARKERGPRMFEAAEVKTLLAAASPVMRAMILLGVNCGMGNTDVAELTRGVVDLERGWVDHPRPKTGIPRRCPLWPETVAALRAALERRPEPRDAADAGIVFITKGRHRWVRVGEPGAKSKGRNQAVVKDSVTMEFGKLVRAAGLHRPGRGFYGLRHSFRTVADEVGDRPAVDLIMGHEDGSDMATHYVERIGDDRLRRVAEHVRGWLFGPQTPLVP